MVPNWPLLFRHRVCCGVYDDGGGGDGACDGGDETYGDRHQGGGA